MPEHLGGVNPASRLRALDLPLRQQHRPANVEMLKRGEVEGLRVDPARRAARPARSSRPLKADADTPARLSVRKRVPPFRRSPSLEKFDLVERSLPYRRAGGIEAPGRGHGLPVARTRPRPRLRAPRPAADPASRQRPTRSKSGPAAPAASRAARSDGLPVVSEGLAEERGGAPPGAPTRRGPVGAPPANALEAEPISKPRPAMVSRRLDDLLTHAGLAMTFAVLCSLFAIVQPGARRPRGR